MKKTVFLMCSMAVTAIFIGCAPKQPTRIVAGGVQAITTMGVDLQDFKNAAGQVTQALLNNPRIKNFKAEQGRLPMLTLGSILNKTDVTIDLAQIAGRINEDLLNSGLVELIATNKGSVNASIEDRVNVKADFFLEGTIMNLDASFDDLVERTYTFQLLVNDRQRKTIFQKTVDIAKQTEDADAVGW